MRSNNWKNVEGVTEQFWGKDDGKERSNLCSKQTNKQPKGEAAAAAAAGLKVSGCHDLLQLHISFQSRAWHQR